VERPSPSAVVEPNKHWGPRHKRVPAVVIECVEVAILAAFLRHLRAGFVFWASG
jgi:thiamine transporter ThiT